MLVSMIAITILMHPDDDNEQDDKGAEIIDLGIMMTI